MIYEDDEAQGVGSDRSMRDECNLRDEKVQLTRLSINNDRIIIIVNIVVPAFLPKVHFIIDGLLLFHVIERLY